MFSVITNIFNKKTKGHILMELFTATGKLKSFFFVWQLQMFDACTTDDTAHIDTIFQVLATHASMWVHRYSSLLQWSMPLGQRGHVAMLLCVLCTKCTLHSNHRLTCVIFQHTDDFSTGAAIFLLHTLASPSGRNVNCDEKQISGKNFF